MQDYPQRKYRAFSDLTRSCAHPIQSLIRPCLESSYIVVATQVNFFAANAKLSDTQREAAFAQ